MAELIIFPQARNVGKVRHVAELYLSKTSAKDQEIYWRMVVSRLAAFMARCGFSQHVIDQQIGAFCTAVQNQIATGPVCASQIPSATEKHRVSLDKDGRPG